MTLRGIFITILSFTAVLGYGAVWLYEVLSRPSPLSFGHGYLEANILVTIFLIIIAVVFFSLKKLIEVPIYHIIQAVEAFTVRNERIPVQLARSTPKELRILVSEFATLIQYVEATHRRESNVSYIKSDFITTAAHQLRTPLTGIRWALEALEKGDTVSEEQRALIENAAEKSHQLVNIVSTLLNISAIESGKHRYTFVTVALDSYLSAIVADFQHTAQERGIELTCQQPKHPLTPVRADKEQIRWILNNLIENAIRYTPHNGRVRVWTEMLGRDKVMVHVSDNGIGIPESDRSNIFERFYRASNAVAKENEGNGLGLYIARTIAKDHGGDLNFASNEGGAGTTFTLSLPIAE